MKITQYPENHRYGKPSLSQGGIEIRRIQCGLLLHRNLAGDIIQKISGILESPVLLQTSCL